MSQLAIVPPPSDTTLPATLTARDVKAQVNLIQEVMQAVMQEGHHYGVIPGTEKPTLLKPGAEKLTVTFRLAPKLAIETIDLGNGHREYRVHCTLTHIPTDRVYGEGVGSCSTMESRYRWRQSERTCPSCGKATIIKGKAEYGGGWLCFAKKGGCGAKYDERDRAITSQAIGRIENEDIADTWNTCLKMAKKRALIDATLTATAASDCFTQDLEDFTPEILPAAPAPAPSPVLPSAVDPQATKPITKGQLDIILLSQKRAGVSNEDFKAYVLPTYKIATLKDLKQKDLQSLLEWFERQMTLKTPAPIDPDQLELLAQACADSGVSAAQLIDYLTQTYQIASPAEIPLDQFDAVLTWVTSRQQ